MNFFIAFLMGSLFSTAQAETIFLKSLPEFGNYEIQIEPIKDDHYYLQVTGAQSIASEVQVVTKQSRSTKNYSFQPLYYQGFRLHKTSRMMKGDKQIKGHVFEFFHKSGQTPDLLYAFESKGKSLSKKFKDQEFHQKGEVGQFMKACGSKSEVAIKTPRGNRALQGLINLCLADSDYKAGVAKLKSITIESSKKGRPQFHLNDGNLRVALSSGLYNSDHALRHWLENNL